MKVRLTVRLKIILTILLVSAVTLGISGYAAQNAATKTRTRGSILDKHFAKFLRHLEKAGAPEYAAAKLVARDSTLVTALEGGDAGLIREAAQSLVGPLQSTLAPDLVSISDATGLPIPGKGLAPLPADEWRRSRLFQDVREAKIVRGELAIVGKEVYQVSGAAVLSGKDVVGTVLIGQRLERFLDDFRDDSTSTTPALQHRVSLVRQGKVVASALPKDMWPGLEAAVKQPSVVQEANEKVEFLNIAGAPYDFFSAPARGYDRAGDPAGTVIGKFYHVRSRKHIADQRSSEDDTTLVVFSLAALLAIVGGSLLALLITRPIKRYIVATEDLAQGQGDLTKRLPVETNDELGVLASNLNRVFAKIHGLASGVQRSAFQVNASSGEIASMSKQMLDGAKEQAAKISGSTAAVTELSSSIQQVAENAAEATKRAQESGEAVTNAISRLEQIRHTVEEAANRIDTLGESGKRIGNIVEVIRQISEQTTMLALNAAIEAAHAGEHGRGFAVVADEVSSLAKRVGQSARDIEDLIATLRDQTTEAVRVMEDGTREVEEGTALVTKTLADLKELVSVIDDTAAAVQEQAIASDEIARNMDAVQRIATEALSSSENAVTQGDHLQTLADDLEQSVKGFKIDPSRPELDAPDVKALPEA